MSESRSESRSSDALSDAEGVIAAACVILDQGQELLERLAPEAYSRTVDPAFGASIGGHYRHCLDHFTAFLDATDSSLLDYDARDRDPRVETDPEFALAATRRLRERFSDLRSETLSAGIVSRCQVHYDLPSPECRSTLGRELVYVVAHAIHHYALISVFARLSDIELPVRFGVAPSTAAYRREQTARTAK